MVSPTIHHGLQLLGCWSFSFYNNLLLKLAQEKNPNKNINKKPSKRTTRDDSLVSFGVWELQQLVGYDTVFFLLLAMMQCHSTPSGHQVWCHLSFFCQLEAGREISATSSTTLWFRAVPQISRWYRMSTCDMGICFCHASDTDCAMLNCWPDTDTDTRTRPDVSRLIGWFSLN